MLLHDRRTTAATVPLLFVAALLGCAESPTGTRGGTLDGEPDAGAPDAAPARRKLLVLCGQSNATGGGRVEELVTPETQALAEPYDLPYLSSVGNDGNPPDVLEHPLDILGPRVARNGLLSFGVELTLGRALDAAEPGEWAIAKFARSSTALGYEWNPNGTYPTLDPSGKNLFTQFVDYVRQAELETGTEVAAFVWIQGEGDSGSTIAANPYGTNLTAFVGRLHESFPATKFVYGRLHTLNPGAYKDVVRAGQESVATQPFMRLVDMDAHSLRNDFTHYKAVSLLDLGTEFGAAVLE